MTEDEGSSGGMINIDSKFWRTTLLLAAVLLIFAGPTYVPYAMNDIAHINYVASTVVGIVLLLAGIGLLWFLVRKRVVL
jgi:hypothetical protein